MSGLRSSRRDARAVGALVVAARAGDETAWNELVDEFGSLDAVVNALKIITADKSVKVILFNIFGGIMRTDDVANGIVIATKQFKVEVPIVTGLRRTLTRCPAVPSKRRIAFCPGTGPIETVTAGPPGLIEPVTSAGTS